MHEREREHEEELRLKQSEKMMSSLKRQTSMRARSGILNTLSAALGVDEDVPAILLDDDEEPEMALTR